MTNVPPIPEMVWQQPLETSVNNHRLDNLNNDSAVKRIQETQRLEDMEVYDVASQISPTKGLQLQFSGTATEQL